MQFLHRSGVKPKDFMDASAPGLAHQAQIPSEERYFNRELSWLSFNERVLAEAGNTKYPLLERLRFLSISGSNLDEFMMIRVAGLAAQIRSDVVNLSIDGKTPQQQIASITAKVRQVEQAQQRILSELRDCWRSRAFTSARTIASKEMPKTGCASISSTTSCL